MVMLYYQVTTILSVVFMLIFAWRWLKHIDLGFTVSFIMIPIINVGYLEIAHADSLGAALVGNKITYLGGCFLNIFLMFGVLSLCHFKVSPLFRTILLGMSGVLYAFVLSIGRGRLFYVSADIETVNGVTVITDKVYGPVHGFFYVAAFCLLSANIVIAVYSFKNRPEVSRNILWRLLILNTACFAAFFGGRAITKDIELMPLFYCILQIVYLGIFKMLRMYDLSAGVADNLILTGTRGMISYDLNHRFLVCNTTALKIIPELKSANADKRLDESIEIFREIDGWIDEYEKDETNNTHTLNSGGAIYEVELEHLKENGKTEGYYILLSDVTQEQKYIESINRYNAQMREAADRAISAEKAKSQFFARMSHEIRTPINAVLGMNEMILQESDDKKILDYAENIDSAGKTLLSVINDILDFSKMEEGKLELMPESYNTEDTIKTVINNMKPKAEQKGLEFITDIDDRLPRVMYGDDIRITQVILNLLSNAIKYTNEGHVKLMIHMISLYEDVVEMSFRVVDTGIGIKDEDQKRLFDSFARLDEHTNRNIEGTGLGMSIVSELLGMMGTSIKVESIYGKGSVFSFRLRQRVVDAAPMGGIEDQDHKEVAGSSRRGVTFKAPKARILVADDNKINLKVAKGFLELMDIEPELVESGSETIERVRAKEYDIIFLDHMMPEMDGIETLSMMKRAGILPDHTAVIALTANAGNGVREQYIDAGFDDYLAKPMNISELSEKLEKYLPPEICMSAYGSDNN